MVRESLVLVTPSWSEVEVPKISSTFNSNPSRCYFFCKCLRHSCVFSNELILCVILLCCHYSFACKFEQYTKSLQSCLTLCDPIDGSPPGLPVPGILQARTLEWVAISFSNAWKQNWKWSRSVMSDSSDPMDCSPSGFSIHGIFQARVLEWGAIAFSIWTLCYS